MTDMRTNGKPEVVAVPPSEGYPKQWFCVAVASDGTIFKGDSSSLRLSLWTLWASQSSPGSDLAGRGRKQADRLG